MAGIHSLSQDEAHAEACKPIFLTNEQLARRWGIGRSTFFALKKAGEVPTETRTPFGPRFRVSDVEAYELRWPQKNVA